MGSLTSDLWGPWRANSPRYGAYSKDITFVSHGESSEPSVETFDAGHPFNFGRSYPAYMNESLTSWGGNVILGDDGLYHLFAAAFGGAGPGPCPLGAWTTNSEVIHATASSPIGPFKMSDVALPSQHHNPHITRAPDGEYLLYTIGGWNSSGKACGYGSCKSCHKGHCGPVRCLPTTPFAPLGQNISLRRRERPKFLFDKSGRPTHMYNGANPGPASGSSKPNPGWVNDRPFTLVTEILPSDSGPESDTAFSQMIV